MSRNEARRRIEKIEKEGNIESTIQKKRED